MLRLISVSALVAAAAGKASSLRGDAHPLPTISQTYCADMQDILLGNGKPLNPEIDYHMCYDRPNLQYSKDVACTAWSNANIDACKKFPKRMVRSIQKDNKMYTLVPKDDKDGWDCVVQASPYQKNSLEIPFDFTHIDDGSLPGEGNAKWVNTTDINGEKANTWMHVRGGTHGTMYWFTSLPDSSGISDMIITDMRNQQGQGNSTIHTSGARHYQKNYTRKIPDGKFDVPKGVKCIPYKPQSAEELFSFGEAVFATEL
jgi:hypothetical protein